MTSYQTTAASTHYNDALPIHFANASGHGGGGGSMASKSSHRHAAGETSTLGTENHGGGIISIVTANDGAVSNNSKPIVATAELAAELLNNLLSAKTTLPDREFKHYSARLKSVVGTISQAHLTALTSILTKTVIDGDKEAARTDLVRFLMLESGVASWATGLRRIIDSYQQPQSLNDDNDDGGGGGEVLISRPSSEASWVEVEKDI
ncbi:hypothetical protein V1514DRAFT_331140 [Lipomyces japonicus]|uniref:uncharacterized protein n=1 Tax=Lipomyces japonicus TaxID=56871 RepID=UPI0034CEE84F